MIPWIVTGAGCVAISPVTVLALVHSRRHWVVAVLATRGSSFKSGRSGPKRGRGRHIRFGGLNVLYDSEGCEYPVDDYGQVYVPFKFEQTSARVENEEEKQKTIKN